MLLYCLIHKYLGTIGVSSLISKTTVL